jgi:predicted transcriptional regulator of viral defense system
VHYNNPRGGITEANRARLTALHRGTSAPFSVQEAAGILQMPTAAARRFLAYLASRGWLARVRRNLYVTVPLDATAPAQWREDPWIVAARAFAPCYVGGWSASEHWGLTEQLFRAVVVLTAMPVRDRHPTIQDTPFHLKVLPESRLFGAVVVWRRGVRVQVSDPSKTVVDLLDDPALGGGMRHVAEIVAAYFDGELRRDATLLEHAERMNNRTIYKRLGYLLETLAVPADELLAVCRERKSSGFSRLDPALPPRSPFLRRWNLSVNAQVTPAGLAG